MENRFARIFISYRRVKKEAANRVYEALTHNPTWFEHVFLDMRDIRGGTDFDQEIVDHLDSCDCFLLFIHDGWEDIERLRNPQDWVHKETRRALERRRATQVPGYTGPEFKFLPVLYDGATMPSRDVLPEELADLASIQAYPVRGAPYLRSDVADELLPPLLGFERSKEARELLLETPTGSMPAVSMPPASLEQPFDEKDARLACEAGDRLLREGEFTAAFAQFHTLETKARKNLGETSIYTLTARQRQGETYARKGDFYNGLKMLFPLVGQLDDRDEYLHLRAQIWLVACFRESDRIDEARAIVDVIMVGRNEALCEEHAPHLVYRFHLEEARCAATECSRTALRLLRQDMGKALNRCRATDPTLADEIKETYDELRAANRVSSVRRIIAGTCLVILASFAGIYVSLPTEFSGFLGQLTASETGNKGPQKPAVNRPDKAPKSVPETAGDSAARPVDIKAAAAVLNGGEPPDEPEHYGTLSFPGQDHWTRVIRPIEDWGSECSEWTDCPRLEGLSDLGIASAIKLRLDMRAEYTFLLVGAGSTINRYEIEGGQQFWGRFPDRKVDAEPGPLKETKSRLYAIQVRDRKIRKKSGVIVPRRRYEDPAVQKGPPAVILSLGLSFTPRAIPQNAPTDELGKAVTDIDHNLRFFEGRLSLWDDPEQTLDLTPSLARALVSHPEPRGKTFGKRPLVDRTITVFRDNETHFARWAVNHLATEIMKRHETCRHSTNVALSTKNLKGLRIPKRDRRRLLQRKREKRAGKLIKRVAKEFARFDIGGEVVPLILVPESWETPVKNVVDALNKCLGSRPAPTVSSTLPESETPDGGIQMAAVKVGSAPDLEAQGTPGSQGKGLVQGGLSCRGIDACATACAPTATECRTACYRRGRPAARRAYDSTRACAQANHCKSAECRQTECSPQMRICENENGQTFLKQPNGRDLTCGEIRTCTDHCPDDDQKLCIDECYNSGSFTARRALSALAACNRRNDACRTQACFGERCAQSLKACEQDGLEASQLMGHEKTPNERYGERTQGGDDIEVKTVDSDEKADAERGPAVLTEKQTAAEDIPPPDPKIEVPIPQPPAD